VGVAKGSSTSAHAMENEGDGKLIILAVKGFGGSSTHYRRVLCVPIQIADD